MYIRFALQHPLQLCKRGLSRCPVAAKHLSRVYLGIFHGWRFSAAPASLHSTLQLLYVSCVKSTDDPELNSLANNNEPKSHLQSPDAKENLSFGLKCFNKALHTNALVSICSSLRDLGTQRAVSLRLPKRSCKVVETLPCEMPNTCAISSI